MTVHRLIVAAAAVLFACSLVAAGCGSPNATATTESVETTGGPALYPISVDGAWGYIDNTGTIKIQPQYESGSPFSEGLAMVRLNGKWGYIGTSGAMVIEPQFDEAYPFTDGLAAVGKYAEDGPHFGYVDQTGAVVIPIQQYGYRPSAFSEGLCMVVVEESGGQTGYIDKTGAMVIGPEFEMGGDFSEGLAGVMSATESGRRGFIDKNGDWVIELQGNLVPLAPLGQEHFSEGLAVVQDMVLDGTESPFAYGYIATSGAVVIQPQFDLATDFSEGLAAVGIKEGDLTKWGYIDKTGAWIIQPQFDNAGIFSEGLAAVAVRTSGTDSGPTWITDYDWGYVDKTGAIVIPLQYQVAGAFSGGVASVENWVESASGAAPVSTAYIDITGKPIWQGK